VLLEQLGLAHGRFDNVIVCPTAEPLADTLAALPHLPEGRALDSSSPSRNSRTGQNGPAPRRIAMVCPLPPWLVLLRRMVKRDALYDDVRCRRLLSLRCAERSSQALHGGFHDGPISLHAVWTTPGYASVSETGAERRCGASWLWRTRRLSRFAQRRFARPRGGCRVFIVRGQAVREVGDLLLAGGHIPSGCRRRSAVKSSVMLILPPTDLWRLCFKNSLTASATAPSSRFKA
jgi:hypothetical protein